MSLALINRIEILKSRAAFFAKTRAFFAQRDVLEVDVPILSPLAPVDLHIDLITADLNGQRAYLHSSPEYGMKRLLCEGIGDIYQISHVFRNGEVGHKHNPEFVMVEWYRHHLTLTELIAETIAFVQLFIDEKKVQVFSYEEAFWHYTGQDFRQIADRDYVFAFEIEPKMQGFVAIYDFPAAEAALAKVENGVAKRFELFYNGVELANGYDELGDSQELKQRFERANRGREQNGKPQYPIDTDFLSALDKGFPACTGVAVGFDRLLMLHHGVTHIEEVIPFAWKK